VLICKHIENGRTYVRAQLKDNPFLIDIDVDMTCLDKVYRWCIPSQGRPEEICQSRKFRKLLHICYKYYSCKPSLFSASDLSL